MKIHQILLVDDDADVRSTLRLLLEMDRYSVAEAQDGKEALERFKSDSFDLVITDYVMPGLSGDQLAIQIKKQAPGVRIIMITAHEGILPKPLKAVDRLLPKPFQIAELKTAIREVSEMKD